MRNVNVTTVDPDTLVDIEDVKIDDSLEGKERVEAYIEQISNPYCHKVKQVIVKNVYKEDGLPLEECFKQIAMTS